MIFLPLLTIAKRHGRRFAYINFFTDFYFALFFLLYFKKMGGETALKYLLFYAFFCCFFNCAMSSMNTVNNGAFSACNVRRFISDNDLAVFVSMYERIEIP